LIEKKNETENEILKDKLKTLIHYLNQPREPFDLNEPRTDILIPQAEGIVTQFSLRPILQNQPNTVNTDDYWLSGKVDGNYELINLDLLESIQIYLPTETITAECKRLFNLSASPPNRDRTTAKNCFRTRRVEVEPTTGRSDKKNYGNVM
jgi:hypothetical protein